TDDGRLPAAKQKYGERAANRPVEILREAFPLVSTLRFGIVQDHPCKWGLSSLKEIVDVNDVNAGARIHPRQELLEEDYVLVVAESQQVIPSRRALEPIVHSVVGQRHLYPAVAEKQYVGFAGAVQRRRFEVEKEG